MDRGDNYKYLNGELKLDEFEEKGFPYPLYAEWLKNTTRLKIFVLKKLYIINIICSKKFITTFHFDLLRKYMQDLRFFLY